jgi:hypothetical protein
MQYSELVEGYAEVDRLWELGDIAAQVALRNQLNARWEASQNAPATYVAAQPQASPPPPPPPPPPAMVTAAVKQADPSIIQYNEQNVPKELLSYLLYEDVSGTELINISRHDTINGQQIEYSLIKNLSVLNNTFNPNNILAGQAGYASYLNQYSIDLPGKIPSYRASYIDNQGNEIEDDINVVYLDNGDLVIEFQKINDDEFAEIQISTNGTIYSIGT